MQQARSWGESLRFFRFVVLYFKRTDCIYKPLRSSMKDLTEGLEFLPRTNGIRYIQILIRITL
jgi:hypothetical protein